MCKDLEKQCLITCISYFLYNLLVGFHKMCRSNADYSKDVEHANTKAMLPEVYLSLCSI